MRENSKIKILYNIIHTNIINIYNIYYLKLEI